MRGPGWGSSIRQKKGGINVFWGDERGEGGRGVWIGGYTDLCAVAIFLRGMRRCDELGEAARLGYMVFWAASFCRVATDVV